MKPSRNIPLGEQAECAEIILNDIQKYGGEGSLMVTWARRVLGRLADAEGQKNAKVCSQTLAGSEEPASGPGESGMQQRGAGLPQLGQPGSQTQPPKGMREDVGVAQADSQAEASPRESAYDAASL